ncbi:hypothetical protein H6P81_005056 [Aristolochia fimbriata]|uniref:Malectin-like domain-containing protein n=1 Tax=Aristolochia fimbriata TaxID=158543 RepID=A0AAV7ETH1_ARIFI|nr:hypothetical protein H6P81_005056 [Aristolochia fimbriata]
MTFSGGTGRRLASFLFFSSPSSSALLPVLVVLINVLAFSFPSTGVVTVASAAAADQEFSPADNYLLDCGAPKSTTLEDGRTFRSDPQSSSFLSTSENVQASTPNISANATTPVAAALYLTARIFLDDSTYSFFISQQGRHWVRLYFYPVQHPLYDLTTAVFSVATDAFVLLHDFSVPDPGAVVFKEYLVNITSDRFSLSFFPMKNSYAFVNAIEIVTAPNALVSDGATGLSPAGQFSGLSSYALEVNYRLNVGGKRIVPANDTLGRTWEPDGEYMKLAAMGNNVSVSPKIIKYGDGGGASPLIAPSAVYATAVEMADSGVADSNFNVTWEMRVDPSFSYLVRLHFCDIVSKSLNDLYFNVYVGGMMGVSSLDLSSLTSALETAYYQDFVINATAVAVGNGTLLVQVGPAMGDNAGTPNAVLNGIEVMKMSNSVGSLDGLFAVDGSKIVSAGDSAGIGGRRVVAVIGIVLAVGAILMLASMFAKWQKRPQGWEKRNSFSSWLLPLHVSHGSLGGSHRHPFAPRDLHRRRARAPLPPHGCRPGHHPPRREDHQHPPGRELCGQGRRLRPLEGGAHDRADPRQHGREGQLRVPRPGVLPASAADGEVRRVQLRGGAVRGAVREAGDQPGAAEGAGQPGGVGHAVAPEGSDGEDHRSAPGGDHQRYVAQEVRGGGGEVLGRLRRRPPLHGGRAVEPGVRVAAPGGVLAAGAAGGSYLDAHLFGGAGGAGGGEERLPRERREQRGIRYGGGGDRGKRHRG